MNWHDRYVQQAGWTRHLRRYLLGQAGLVRARRVLEVGCGTGAVLMELETPAGIHGLDLDAPRLRQAQVHAPAARLVCGNALDLPFASQSFAITFCHFLLLWAPDPLRVLLEMKRVTCRGGAVLALAEPDYTQREDRPAGLAQLGAWQTEALRSQGADPSLGGRLGDLFMQAGFSLIEAGKLSRKEGGQISAPEWEMEWAVLESDLRGRVTDEELRKMKARDEAAWKRGKRSLYVPTFYALGVV